MRYGIVSHSITRVTDAIIDCLKTNITGKASSPGKMSSQIVQAIKKSSPQCHSGSGAVQLTGKNIVAVIGMNELVIIRFYDKRYWSEFMQIDELANSVKKAFPRIKKVLIGKVDSEEADAAVSRLGFSRGYTGTVLFRNGQHIRQVYTFQQLQEIVFSELENPIKQLHTLGGLENIDTTKHLIVGYFDKEGMPEYDNFRRVAHNVKKYCQFYIRYGYSFDKETSKNLRPPNQPTIVFRPGNAQTNDSRETFKGCMKNYDDLNLWAHKKCMVREMTFDNFQELSDERLPFLTLFYNPSNHKSVKDFCDIVGRTLMDQKLHMNCVKVDGIKFAQHLKGYGKNKKDLPLIVMCGYIFTNFKDIYTPGKLKSFAANFGWCGYKSIRQNVSIDEFVKSMNKRKQCTSLSKC